MPTCEALGESASVKRGADAVAHDEERARLSDSEYEGKRRPETRHG